MVVNNVTGLDKGLYEVDLIDHALKIATKKDLRAGLRDASIGAPRWITEAACVVVLCADMITPIQSFAEQKPFGARGARYVYLEAGAAAQNLQLQAVAEELGCVWVGGFNDDATDDVLGLQEPLSPILLLCVGHPQAQRKLS